jgi:methionine synthase I (cobalamin-dependent)
MRRFVEEGWVNAIDGCCGTPPGSFTSLYPIGGEGR